MIMVNILIGCTGSVASIKISDLVCVLKQRLNQVNVQIVATEKAKHFLNFTDQSIQIWEDKDEWSQWKKMGDPILHIELRNWADIFLIAPLDANTLGKLANGLCDNLLTSVARAWDIYNKPFVVCPAMNTVMWKHPCTKKSLEILKEWGYLEVPPISKKLACGEEGMGAMANISDILNLIVDVNQNSVVINISKT